MTVVTPTENIVWFDVALQLGWMPISILSGHDATKVTLAVVLDSSVASVVISPGQVAFGSVTSINVK